jgi:poly-beta-1,6-N-acetyl-D-glucosamine synthase
MVLYWPFWGAAFGIIYTYFGYGVWLWIRYRFFPRPVRARSFYPFISIVMVVRNEAALLSHKLLNLGRLNYPANRMETIVVSDGSNDITGDILSAAAAGPGFRILLNPQHRGKSAGLNDAVHAARGEILVFSDVRQKIEPDAIKLLMENFADSDVGCASGQLMLGDPDAGEPAKGMGLYWKYEKWIRQLESSAGSVIGSTGAIYAMRRDLFVDLPQGTILDDVYLPMNVLRQGARVIFDPRACAWDVHNMGGEKEFRRKVRTLSGNYQLLQLAPWLLGKSNPARFQFVSHKLLRLVVPLFLATTLVTAFFLPGAIYRIALALQLAFYASSALKLLGTTRGPWARIADAAFTFLLLNTAAIVAFVNFIFRRKPAWTA